MNVPKNTEALDEIKVAISQGGGISDLANEWLDSLADATERITACSELLLRIEGSMLAYWTDMPEAEFQSFTILIREFLGDFEPATR